MKNLWSKFFFPSKIEAKNFEIQFFQKISYTILLFDSKYEFRMISVFIWYAYCPRWRKITNIQKSVRQKLENLYVKLSYFGVTFWKNWGSYEVAQSFYRCTKILSFIWDHVWTDLGKYFGCRSSKSLSGIFHPPSLYRSTGKPTLIRVNFRKEGSRHFLCLLPSFFQSLVKPSLIIYTSFFF